MTFRDKFWVVGVTILFLFLLSASLYSGVTYWQSQNDYDTHLTQEQLLAIDDDNMVIVFYKRSCPYCQAGKKDVIRAGKKSALPVFYVDVETNEGKILVSRYGIKHASTLMRLREGAVTYYSYAKKINSRIVSDRKMIDEAFGD